MTVLSPEAIRMSTSGNRAHVILDDLTSSYFVEVETGLPHSEAEELDELLGSLGLELIPEDESPAEPIAGGVRVWCFPR